VLFGRAVEVELIESFVTGRTDFGGVLVVAGEAGAGKSALLDAGAEIAARAGRRVLRAAALKYEAELQFGGLNQLLHPLADRVDGLRDEHRQALDVVLGLASGAMPSQLIVGAATLALLREAATADGGGLLLIVDDVQWLDLSSGMAMIYAMRRLEGAEVRMLVASRSEETGDAFVRSGFRVLDVPSLDDASSDELLVSAFPALPTTVRHRLRADAQGNPLALLELPTVRETGGPAAAVPGVLPLTKRLQSVFAERLKNLPEETHRTLLLVVLAGAGSGVGIEDVVPTSEGQLALAPAERARILRRNARTGRLEFRHTLIRSAVFELSTSQERRAAHRALADIAAASPQHRAWHLGQAAVEPTRRSRVCWRRCRCGCCARAAPTECARPRPCCVRRSSARLPTTGHDVPRVRRTWGRRSPAISPRCADCFGTRRISQRHPSRWPSCWPRLISCSMPRATPPPRAGFCWPR
jgi:hypothetical protein